VDVDSDGYQVARKYMIRLEKGDFDELKNIARLALIGNMKTDEFIEKFKYLITDPPIKNKSKSESDKIKS
jgi:6-phosphofructokinase 1